MKRSSRTQREGPSLGATPRTTQLLYGPAHVASIRQCDWQAVADEPLPDWNEPERPVTLRDLERDGVAGARNGWVSFPAGLVERLTAILERRGVRLYTNAMEWAHYEKADPFCLTSDELSSRQREFLVATNGRGNSLVVAPRPEDEVELLEALSARFPSNNIVVVVKNNTIADTLARRLRQRTQRDVTWGQQPSLAYTNRLHIDAVGTFYERRRDLYGIVVWLWSSALAARSQVDLLNRADYTVWFGLLESPLEQLHPRDALAIEAYFGPCLLDLSRRREALTDVNVVWLPPSSYPAAAATRSIEQRDAMLWSNDARNRDIASLAAALRRGDQRALHAAGVNHVDAVVRQRHGCERLTVAIVVENSHHADQLSRLLSDWEVLSGEGRQVLFDLMPDQAIVTLPTAHRHGLAADAVVYAVGGEERWHDACGPPGFGLGETMLLVDFKDDYDDRVIAEAIARNRDYGRRGWTIRNAEVFPVAVPGLVSRKPPDKRRTTKRRESGEGSDRTAKHLKGKSR